jgi:GNAT superfamily N-acetyltransferase
VQPASIVIEALEPRLLDAWARLFDACASSCFCRYWHFTGDKNAWLERCAFSPDDNRKEQAALVTAGDPLARGLVALRGDDIVGWMKLAPRASLPKLRALPVYRAHDLGDDAGVYAIGCLLVDPAHRGTGVARALVGAAPSFARTWGARAIEAYPRASSEPLHPEEAWMGPRQIFLDEGFTRVGGEMPYEVLRRVL